MAEAKRVLWFWSPLTREANPIKELMLNKAGDKFTTTPPSPFRPSTLKRRHELPLGRRSLSHKRYRRGQRHRGLLSGSDDEDNNHRGPRGRHVAPQPQQPPIVIQPHIPIQRRRVHEVYSSSSESSRDNSPARTPRTPRRSTRSPSFHSMGEYETPARGNTPATAFNFAQANEDLARDLELEDLARELNAAREQLEEQGDRAEAQARLIQANEARLREVEREAEQRIRDLERRNETNNRQNEERIRELEQRRRSPTPIRPISPPRPPTPPRQPTPPRHIRPISPPPARARSPPRRPRRPQHDFTAELDDLNRNLNSLEDVDIEILTRFNELRNEIEHYISEGQVNVQLEHRLSFRIRELVQDIEDERARQPEEEYHSAEEEDDRAEQIAQAAQLEEFNIDEPPRPPEEEVERRVAENNARIAAAIRALPERAVTPPPQRRIITPPPPPPIILPPIAFGQDVEMPPAEPADMDEQRRLAQEFEDAELAADLAEQEQVAADLAEQNALLQELNELEAAHDAAAQQEAVDADIVEQQQLVEELNDLEVDHDLEQGLAEEEPQPMRPIDLALANPRLQERRAREAELARQIEEQEQEAERIIAERRVEVQRTPEEIREHRENVSRRLHEEELLTEQDQQHLGDLQNELYHIRAPLANPYTSEEQRRAIQAETFRIINRSAQAMTRPELVRYARLAQALASYLHDPNRNYPGHLNDHTIANLGRQAAASAIMHTDYIKYREQLLSVLMQMLFRNFPLQLTHPTHNFNVPPIMVLSRLGLHNEDELATAEALDIPVIYEEDYPINVAESAIYEGMLPPDPEAMQRVLARQREADAEMERLREEARGASTSGSQHVAEPTEESQLLPTPTVVEEGPSLEQVRSMYSQLGESFNDHTMSTMFESRLTPEMLPTVNLALRQLAEYYVDRPTRVVTGANRRFLARIRAIATTAAGEDQISEEVYRELRHTINAFDSMGRNQYDSARRWLQVPEQPATRARPQRPRVRIERRPRDRSRSPPMSQMDIRQGIQNLQERATNNRRRFIRMLTRDREGPRNRPPSVVSISSEEED